MVSRYKFLNTFFILNLLLLSCSEDDSYCKVTSCKTSTLIFEEAFDRTIYNKDFSGKFYFEYNSNNQISTIYGGLALIPAGSNLNAVIFTDDVKTDIVYEGGIIKVNQPYSQVFNTEKSPYPPDEYIIQDDKIISFTKTFYPSMYKEIYRFEYFEDEIYEYKNEFLIRTYFLINGNLIKVEQINYSFWDNSIVSKKEILLKNYDNNENLLKGKFFIKGAFYKAFSSNNFRNLEINNYIFENNDYRLSGYRRYSIDFNVRNGVPDLFEQECN